MMTPDKVNEILERHAVEAEELAKTVKSVGMAQALRNRAARLRDFKYKEDTPCAAT